MRTETGGRKSGLGNLVGAKDRAVKGTRGRPRRADAELRGDTRVGLLQAASDLMIAKNSVDISLAEVSALTGKSPALSVYHFSNKEGLLLALLERDAAKAVAQLRELATLDLPVEKKMRMHIGGLINAYHKTPYANRLLHELMQNASEESARRVSEIFLKPIADFQKTLLEQGLRGGVFREVDPRDFYFIVVGACDHLFARRCVLTHIFDTAEISEETKKHYAQSLIGIVMAGILA